MAFEQAFSESRSARTRSRDLTAHPLSRLTSGPENRRNGLPQLCPQSIGPRRDQRVGDDRAFDHVGNDGHEWTTFDPNRHRCAAIPSPQTPVDADDPWWAPESGRDQSTAAKLPPQGAGGGGEFGGRGFHVETSVAPGCGRVVLPGQRTPTQRSGSARQPARTVDSVETNYNPAQQRVIDLLGRTDERPVVDPDLASSIRSDLEAAIAPFHGVLPDGKSYEHRFFLNKQALTNVHSCEAYYLDGSGEFEWNLANCRGTVVHKAIEVSINLRHPMPPTDLIEEAIERLSNESAKSISLFLATLDEFSRAELIGDCSALFTRFTECFPPIKRSWIPSVETPVALNLANGRIRVSGKVDLALGRPPDKVIIDLKTGRAAAAHYDDLRLYALIDFLAIGMAPRKVASYYLDSAEIHHEDIAEGTLLSAARRLQDGLVRAIELKYAHSPAARRPSGICNWCTLNTDCDVGTAYLEQRKEDEGW